MVKKIRYAIYKIVSIDDEHNFISLSYDYLMIILILLSIIPLCFKHSNEIFIIIETTTVICFIVDYILRWSTADYLLNKGMKSFLMYPLTPFAIIDLLSILPSLNLINPSFKLFRLLRLNKIFKALKILRYSKSFILILDVLKQEKQALLGVVYLSIGYIFLTALILFNVEPESFNTFFDAIYWAVVTLTTVGYGDLYPCTNLGRIIAMISSFVGIAIVALPAGIISAGFISKLNK